MKPISLLTIALLLSLFAFTQKSSTPSFSHAISAVLEAVPVNFYSISGEPIVSQAGGDDYASLVMVPGAVSCWITRYHSQEDTTASWQALMYKDEDFSKASARYKELYRQLKTCYLKTVDGSTFFLNAEWSAPTEESKFALSTLRVITGDERYKNIQIGLEQHYEFPLWVITIHVGTKKNDTLEE